jgi:methyl-accepting chemotaxis protein
MTEIADNANAQSAHLQQINTTVGEMDRMTQQNAAMVEQSTAASRSLADEANELSALVSRFQAGEFVAPATHAPAELYTPARAPNPSVVRMPVPRAHRGGQSAAAEKIEDWCEF